MTKISICIPTFNRINLLPVAIESVIKQTYTGFELIVCDDGSSDGTPELMAQYQDNRIRYIRHSENIGKSNNMRSGFEAARGEYFIKFDDDDRLTPEFIERTVSILDKYPKVDFVGTDHWIIDINNTRNEEKTQENSAYWGRKKLSEGVIENLLEVVFIRQSFQIGATLFRRKILRELEYMQPHWQNCEDNDLFVRLALAGKKAYYLPELLMEYRVHSEQQSKERAIRYLSDKINYLENYKFDVEKIEKIRQKRLIDTKLILGLRLIEQGETQKGRELVFAGKSSSGSKAFTGFGLSFLPMSLRGKAFDMLRQASS
ncbi:MAG: glycosyltransferase family 2 protein [Cyanobacteria bacterium P01_A01_bin.84]